ncbi:thioredoxin domain-containing protein [Virgibacillus phasianinus]|uniref:thioredoxin domain-containing protein n=1 Tax=Virgibacillus phasianinus TaxID=2017483 RepID=UPI001FE3E717|nr:thioredoxin domain-containing protein [Virgibacillus phasianinus]
MNKLANEKSPYLLQHAENPVDWYPWGDEAFNKAKQENKPIFLSVGYSACHWCHVFAHESFEDVEVAKLLNERFVSIKVDREERPDIDAVYMKVCQMMTGQGGWPLSIFMTPEKIPFYAGTYFPKESRYGMPGFIEVITQLYRKFTEDPDHISEVTKSVTQALQQTATQKSEQRLTKDVADKAFHLLEKLFDRKHGGFGGAPKFPAPHNLLFLMRYYNTTGNDAALEMAEVTLKAMAKGGIYDHVGFGFSRYSTDDEWLVPHFEKMLYDNALLLMAYTECYQLTGDSYYQEIGEEIIGFITREMINAEGVFYSAIDADSEGVEGKYYIWEKEEIIGILDSELGQLYCDVYGITEKGNFEGMNIPNQIDTDLTAIKKDYNLNDELLYKKLGSGRKQLLKARSERVYPHVDDKMLTSWNALMIAALAKAGKVFGRQSYVDTAKKALDFLEENLIVHDRVMARYLDGDVKHKGYIDDYAFLLWAYVELYETTYESSYLKNANKTADDMFDLFWDKQDGGFFFYGSDSEELIMRGKEVYDAAIPSGNSVAAVMLTRLGHLTGETAYLDRVDEMYYTFKDDVEPYANGSTFFMQSILLTEFPTKEVVIIGDQTDKTRQDLIEKLNRSFLPSTAILVGESSAALGKIAPFTHEYRKVEGKTTIYVCENFACNKPTTELKQAITMIVD